MIATHRAGRHRHRPRGPRGTVGGIGPVGIGGLVGAVGLIGALTTWGVARLDGGQGSPTDRPSGSVRAAAPGSAGAGPLKQGDDGSRPPTSTEADPGAELSGEAGPGPRVPSNGPTAPGGAAAQGGAGAQGATGGEGAAGGEGASGSVRRGGSVAGRPQVTVVRTRTRDGGTSVTTWTVNGSGVNSSISVSIRSSAP